jgi:phospholipid/cholesterol/gamma-HCH transport system ATP-binding protein
MSNIGFLFQGGALFDSLSVFENVAFRLINYDKIPRQKARDIAVEKLNLVGLDSSILDNEISSLSGGMQKRVSLARTICYNPKIIFFDEPTTGLDPIMTSIVSDLIMKCRQNLKSTNIVVTHEMKLAREIGDKIIFLSKGDIVWNGSKNTIDNPNNKTVYNFVNGVVSDQAV